MRRNVLHIMMIHEIQTQPAIRNPGSTTACGTCAVRFIVLVKNS